MPHRPGATLCAIGEPDLPLAPGSDRGHPVGRISTLSFAALLFDRVLALVLVALIAALYGAGTDADTYFLALIVPTTLGVALSETLYTVLLPVFTRAGAPAQALLGAAMRLAAGLIAAILVVYVAVVVLLGPRHLPVWLAFAAVLVAMPMAGVYAAFLTAARRYALAVMRVPLATALAVLAASAVLPFWRSITVLAIAVALGQVATLALLALRSHERRAVAAGTAPALSARQLVAAGGSVLFAALVGGLAVVPVERFLASGLREGAVGFLAYARGLALLPGMIPQALGSGIFPAATERHESLDRDALSRLAVLALRLGLLAAVASTAIVVVCRAEIVEIALQRGDFDERAAGETTPLVAILGISLVGIAAASIANRALFALARERLVAAVSAFGAALYVAAAVVLRELAGIEGLAAAFAVAAIGGGAILVGYLAAALELSAWTAVREWLLAPCALGAAFAAGAYAGWAALRGAEGFWGSLVTVGASTAGGLAALLAVVVALRGTEYVFLRSALRRRSIRAVREQTLAERAGGTAR